LNRFTDAQVVEKQAQAKNLDSSDVRLYRYELAFLQNDGQAMAKQIAGAADKRGEGGTLLHFAAATAAYFGQLAQAREIRTKQWNPPSTPKKTNGRRGLNPRRRSGRRCSETDVKHGGTLQVPSNFQSRRPPRALQTWLSHLPEIRQGRKR
jgi:hypothetical protein